MRLAFAASLTFVVLAVACGSSSSNPASGSDAGAPSSDPKSSQIDGASAIDGGGPGRESEDGGAPGARWIPSEDTTFFWQLSSPPTDTSKNVGAYDIDGFDTSAAFVTSLHSAGKKVVCYMDAGTYEPGRPDASQFPAALLGADVQGWPGEKWLDVRPSGPNYKALQAIMLARFQICAQKGFDAIEADNIDSYENSPGFSTSASDQLAYDQWIASTAHSLGLAVFQKNDLDQIPDLVSDFDGVLDEECNKYSECDTLQPYVDAKKPVWNAEYTDDGETTTKFCAADVSAGIVGALYNLDLDGTEFEPCPNDVGATN